MCLTQVIGRTGGLHRSTASSRMRADQESLSAVAGEPAPPAGDRHPGERARRLWQRRSGGTLLLLLPAFIALTLLFFLPIVRIAIQSFTEPELGLHNYVAMLTDDYSFRVLVRTLVVSGAVALFGALFAYPYA